MKKLTLFALAILILIGCGGGSGDQSPENATPLEVHEVAIFADNEDWMLSNINQVILDSQKRIIFPDMNQRKVYYLDADGELIQIFGSQGSGPGEFQSMGPIIMMGDDRLVAADFMQRRMNEFRIENGEWKSQGTFYIDNDPANIFAFGFKIYTGNYIVNNPFVMVGGMPEPDRVFYREVTYRKINGDGEILEEEYLTTMGNASIMSQSGGAFNFAVVPFMETEHLAVSPDGYIYKANNLEFRIEKLNADLETVKVYELPWTRQPVSDKDATDFLDNYEGNFRNTLRGLLPEIKPVIRTIRVSDQNEVWVQVYGAEDNVTWIVLNEDGSVKGSVKFPERTNLHHIRGNKAYTVSLDEFDVPRIVVFEVTS